MSLPAVKWGDVQRYFNSNSDYTIYYQGGDAIIAKKASGEGQGRRTVRIGHRFLNHTKELRPAHLKKIERAFGITFKDILGIC